MSLSILWTHAALARFYSLPRHSAAIVDRAVIRFAERGEGEVVSEPPHHILRAGFHNAVVAIDRRERTLAVLAIYRAR